jgi:superfamily II DNA or RNA helicase
MVLETPARLRLPKSWVGSSVEKELADELGYEDQRLTFEWRTWARVQKMDDARILAGDESRRHWFVMKFGREALDEKVASLAAQRHKSLLFRDEHGLWTYSGMAPRIAERYGEKVERAYKMPAHTPVPWATTPFEPRWYQREAESLLVPLGHGGAELATGLGKSLIIANICRRIGRPAVVVAPTLSIAEQLYSDFETFFGSRAVGRFFGGKKEAEKYFVIAVSKSLTGLVPGSRHAQLLAAKQVLVGDESHLLPAETLSKVVLGLFANVPYRFFLSGTQLRNDGLDLLLEAIVGGIVIRMDVRQGVDEGFLARPRFFQFAVRSDLGLDIPDAVRMNRVHLHQNENVYKHAAALVHNALKQGRRPLVLVEEVPQFTQLLRHLKVPAGFAHGGVDRKMKTKLPQKYHKSDPRQLVAAFDRAELPVLVGTQCIGVGTDIKSASFIVDMVGLSSEIRIRQNVGRGTRLFAGKTDTIYCDYDIWNVPKLAKQAEKRAKVFNAIYGPVKFVRS